VVTEGIAEVVFETKAENHLNDTCIGEIKDNLSVGFKEFFTGN